MLSSDWQPVWLQVKVYMSTQAEMVLMLSLVGPKIYVFSTDVVFSWSENLSLYDE